MSGLMNKPILGITIGDPAGIGPEITLKALKEKEFYDMARPIVIGSYQVMEQALQQTGISLKLHRINKVADGLFVHNTVDVLDLDNMDVRQLKMGQVQSSCGQASYEYI